MIYLDNAATTRMHEKGVEVYQKYACQSFFNPSAGYNPSIDISKDLDIARTKILAKLGASAGNIIFTSGATESNNLAIMGSKRNGKWEYVFSVGEHPSVYNVAKELEKQGYVVHIVSLRKDGQVDYEKLSNVLNEKTRLISVMHVSNETGAINDIRRVNKLRNDKCKNALLHVDGVQAFCKIPVNLSELGADLYSISAHKFHGPKGVGALYVKNTNSLKSIVFGGGQEGDYRSGTENVAGIMAMSYAMDSINVNQNYEYVSSLKRAFIDILARDNKIKVIESESPYIVSASFSGVNGETLMRALQDEGIYVSTGSACSSKKAGNRILEAMGISKEEVKSHLRISFSEENTMGEVCEGASIILKVYNEIWERVK